MGIGVNELVLLLLVTASALVGVKLTKRRWLLGLPAMFVVAILFSPADPLSTLLIALPCCCIYSFALFQVLLFFSNRAPFLEIKFRRRTNNPIDNPQNP